MLHKLTALGVAATLFGGLATLIAPMLADKDDDKPPAMVPVTPSQAPTRASTGSAAPSKGQTSAPSQEPKSAYQLAYPERLLKLRTPRSNECWNAFVDFDEGRAGSDRSRVAVSEEADVALTRCASFGFEVHVANAGAVNTPITTAEQCLEAARGGGIQTVEGFDLLKDEDPIKRGTVLCVETSEGKVARALAEEVKWTRLGQDQVEWAVDYTFRVTTWQKNP
ncbi:hypothetical protein [Streptomyces sp. NPDC012888]|uniref:hypothetical protein n=1 Tax=Streptomyces sp. NPDC012888 TaxID=3364855 RepID=UPI00369B16D7